MRSRGNGLARHHGRYKHFTKPHLPHVLMTDFRLGAVGIAAPLAEQRAQ